VIVFAAMLAVTSSGISPPPFPEPDLSETTARFGERWDAWRESVPKDQHAYPAILSLYAEFEALKGEDDFRPQGSADMWPEEFDRTVAFVRGHPEYMAKLRAADLGPILGASIDGDGVDHIREHRERLGRRIEAKPRPDTPVGIVLPHYQHVGHLANLLITEAVIAAQSGDVDTLAANLEQAFRLGRFLDEPPIPLGAISMARINADAARSIARLDLARIDEDALARLDRLLAVPSLHGESRYLRELWISTATLEWIFADAGEPGLLTPEGTRRWHAIHKMSSWDDNPLAFAAKAFGTAPLSEQRAAAARLLDAVRADLATPRHAIDSPTYERAIERIESNRFGPLLLNAGTAAHPTKVYERTTQHEQWPIAVRLRIAAERHRLRHGSFPESIAVMDDDLLTFDPIDLFTGEPLHYVLSDRGPRIYSSGPDRDHDNAQIVGEMPIWIPIGRLSEMNDAQREAINGDIVFFGTP